MGDFSSVEDSIPQFTPEETLAYINYIQKYASQQPRTYWITIPFYIVIKDHKQQFRFGYRPEDLAHIDTIEQKAWKKHEVYLKRLEQFPLDKAEYYARMKEIHGISTVRSPQTSAATQEASREQVVQALNRVAALKISLKARSQLPLASLSGRGNLLSSR